MIRCEHKRRPRPYIFDKELLSIREGYTKRGVEKLVGPYCDGRQLNCKTCRGMRILLGEQHRVKSIHTQCGRSSIVNNHDWVLWYDPIQQDLGKVSRYLYPATEC